MARNIHCTSLPATVALILIILNVIIIVDHQTEAQRSLQHWKRDLEHRLRLYHEQQNTIESIVSSSIYAARGFDNRVNGPVHVTSNGNVRFSDLIIPTGSLRLSNHVAPSSIRILVDKTRAYVNSKANELFQIQSQLETIHRQLDDPSNRYIYKGRRDVPQPQRNFSGITIEGTRVFKQVQYAHLIESYNVTLRRINYTDVNRVIDDTYLRNLKLGVFDSHGRLFLEGRKTFWDTVFSKSLQSGCCDRLKPLHTNRMMLRSARQDVRAPILIQSRDTRYGAPGAVIRQLSTGQLYNRVIAIDQQTRQGAPTNVPGATESNLLASPAENFIQLQNLIDLRQPNQAQILKTIVFRNPITIEEALLANSYPDNRLVIGIASQPGFFFDLSHDNYLLRYSYGNNAHRNSSSLPVQTIQSGPIVIDGVTNFIAGVDAVSVNRVVNFAQFAQESIVSIHRPSVIRGPIQFNALPAMLNRDSSSMSRPPSQNVQILHVYKDFQVGLVNGMQIPRDLVLLHALQPGAEIRVRGPRHFENRLTFDFLYVNGLVNGLSLPDGVIPLHLNDFMHNVGHSNLRFLDGITVAHMTIQSNQFDEINLRDVNGDAQSIVIRSMSAVQADGSLLIRAPLRVQNLNLINGGPNRGLLNGFRPQEVLELTSRGRNPYEILYGRKKFLAHVEAADCIFSDINQVANWTSHLIRIDRPNTIQTVHTRLAFTSAPAPTPAIATTPVRPPPPFLYNVSSASSSSSVVAPSPPPPYPLANNNSNQGINLNRLDVEFYPETSKDSYESNWNFSPELYLLYQSLQRSVANYTGGRYRVEHVRLIRPGGGALVNNIQLGDVVRLDEPIRFADTFTMVGKVEVKSTLSAGRIQSNYPIDAMNLVEFNRFRIPLGGNSRAPIRLTQLVLGPENKATFVQCRMLNGISFKEFAQSIMSLTRPQDVYSNLMFNSAISFEGPVRTKSSLNGIKNFEQFARNLKDARYSFEEGLQCNSVVIKT